MNCVENYEQRDVERRQLLTLQWSTYGYGVFFFTNGATCSCRLVGCCRTGAGVESRFVVAQGLVSSPDSDTLLVTFFSCCVVSGVSSYHSEINSHLWYDLSRPRHKTGTRPISEWTVVALSYTEIIRVRMIIQRAISCPIFSCPWAKCQGPRPRNNDSD